MNSNNHTDLPTQSPLRKMVSLPESQMGSEFSFEDAIIPRRLSKEMTMEPTMLNRQTTTGPIMSANVKFQELPEFRLDHALIETVHKKEETETIEEIHAKYTKIQIQEANIDVNDPFIQEYSHSAKSLLDIVKIRDKYIFDHCQYKMISDLIETNKGSPEPLIMYCKENRRLPKLEDVSYKTENGVLVVYKKDSPIHIPISMDQYLDDLMLMIKQTHNSSNKSFAFKRLHVLEKKFEMHLLYNREKEVMEQKCKQKRDFYKVRKVDTHVHHSAFMNINSLLKFIKNKMQTEPDTSVILDPATASTLTLRQVFDKYQLTPETLNVEVLDMQAGFETFQRFDRFNKKYNPFSRTDFREIFLKSDNLIGGKYLAEITKEVFETFNQSKYLLSEPRISVYGKSRKEWEKLADWFDKYEIYHHQVRWLIQVPRLYEVYKKAGIVQNFQHMIDNIFQILFEVTINPDSNPKLYKFLLQVVGFDSVDDESVYEATSYAQTFKIPPEEWTYAENPHYCYWAYYFWANITSLNYLRKMRGLNSFEFRPHCGEAGSSEHLMAAYLLADGINHGIRLEKAPVLQYLFYLKQIGLAMSPLSNNKLFLKYKDNPLPKFLARGLNISLSTDDPLIFHMTHEPLMEEYSIASQVYDLSTTDLCEIARNSVLQSGFEDVCKSYWIGKNYKSLGHDGNDFEKTNLPNTRYLYRLDTLKGEFHDLHELAKVSS